MRGLEFVAEHDRPRGLIIPGDAFQEHPGRRHAYVPGRKPDDCDGGWGERREGQGADDRDPERRRCQAMLCEDLIDSPNCRIVIDYMTG